MKDKLVSIIMPNYNCQKYVAEAMDSVINQTYKSWELIIVDDGSDDSSIKIIEKYREQDARIQLIQLGKNSGATIARNKGIQQAKGDLMAFIDSDDVWMKDRLEKTVLFLLSNDYDFVYSSYKRCDESLRPLLPDYIVTDALTFNDLLYHNPISTPTVLINIARLGKFYQPDTYKREDYTLWLSILKKVPQAHGIQEPLMIYRIRKNSLSRNKIEIAKAQYDVYKNYLGMNRWKSFYYLLHWIFNGLKKYGKI